MGPEEEPPLLGPVVLGPHLVGSEQRWGDTEWPCRPLSPPPGVPLARPSPPTRPHCSQARPRLALSEVGAGSAPVLGPAVGERGLIPPPPHPPPPPVFWSTRLQPPDPHHQGPKTGGGVGRNGGWLEAKYFGEDLNTWEGPRAGGL